MTTRNIMKRGGALLVFILLVGCSSPEQKRAKFYAKGVKLYEQDRRDKASLEFRNAIQIDPKFADAYYMLGLIEDKRGNVKGAYDNQLTAVRLAPGNLKARYQLGRIYLGLQAPDKTLEEVEVILKREPANAEALVLKGAALVKMKETDRAIALLNEVVGKTITTPESYQILALAYRNRGDIRNAEDAIRKGIGANPAATPLLRTLADICATSGRKDEAAALARKAMEAEPTIKDHRLYLARLLWENGKEQQAKEVVTGLIADDRDVDSRLLVADFYARRGRNDLVEQLLKESLAKGLKDVRLSLALGDVYRASGSNDKAEKVLKESLAATKKGPDAVKLRIALAELALSRNQKDVASAYTEEVLKESPKNSEAHLLKGRLAFAKGDFITAISEFRTVVTDKPRFAQGIIMLAQAHIMNKEQNLAADVLQSALKADPDTLEVRRALAELYLAQNDKAKALELMRKGVELAPETIEARLALGDCYLATGDPRRAEGEYEAAKRLAPASKSAYLKLADLYNAEHKPARVIAELEKVVALDPTSDVATGSLVRLYITTKNYPSATALVEQRLRSNPRDAGAWFLLSQVRIARKEYASAQEALEKAVESRPESPEFVQELAKILVIQGKKEQAMTRLEQALKTNPDTTALYIYLAELNLLSKNFSRAAELYQQALTRRPDFWAAANDLAFVLSEYLATPENLNKALIAAQQALALRPGDPTVLDTLGWVHFRKGDTAMALDLLKKAQNKAPESPLLNYHLGMAHSRSGQTEQARVALKKSLAGKGGFPGRDEAEKTLSTLKSG